MDKILREGFWNQDFESSEIVSMKVAIFGVSGFIGGNLSAFLRRKGVEVCEFNRSSIVELSGLENDESDFGVQVSEDKCALTFEELSDVDVAICLIGSNKAHELVRSNELIPPILFEICAQAGVKQFIYLSTSKTMGETLDLSNKRLPEVNRCRPISGYGQSKLKAEGKLKLLSNALNCPSLTIIRPPMVYGPGMNNNLLKLIKWIDFGMPVILNGRDAARSMIYVLNLCEFIYSVSLNEKSFGKIFAPCDRETVTVSELINTLGNIMNVKNVTITVPTWFLRMIFFFGRKQVSMNVLDPFVLDYRHVFREVDWLPPHSSLAGLEETVRWYENK